MKLRETLIATLAAGFVAAAGIAVAQPMSHGPGGPGAMGGSFHHSEAMELLQSLKLTEAQQRQVRQIEQDAWAKDKPLIHQMRDIHRQMIGRMLSTGALTAEQFAPALQQEQQLRAQMDTARLATVLQIRALLTPDQLSQAAATHAKLETLHEQERGLMGGDHD